LKSVLDSKHLAKKLKDRGRDTLLKRIANSGEALMAVVFGEWKSALELIRKERLLHEAKVGRECLLTARQRAYSALEKSLNASAEALQLMCLTAWHDEVEKAKRVAIEAKQRIKRKEQAAQRALRAIAGDQEALMSRIFIDWAGHSRDEKKDALSRARQARLARLGRDSAVRARLRLSCRVAWDAWAVRALV